MKDHSFLSDLEFERMFEQGDLDPALFTHEAHLRMAWICVNKYGETAAAKRMAGLLYRFVLRAGSVSKYNHTVTIAAMKIVGHFMRRTPENDFGAFMSKNPRLKTGFRELLSSHYSFDVFELPVARITFIEPDLLPFD